MIISYNFYFVIHSWPHTTSEVRIKAFPLRDHLIYLHDFPSVSFFASRLKLKPQPVNKSVHADDGLELQRPFEAGPWDLVQQQLRSKETQTQSWRTESKFISQYVCLRFSWYHISNMETTGKLPGMYPQIIVKVKSNWAIPSIHPDLHLSKQLLQLGGNFPQ